MANIQLENGYTKIANQLLDKLSRVKMSGQNWQILIAIIRKLYGFNKKEDWIEYSQIMKLTNLPKSRISECIKSLRIYGIVTQKRNGIRQLIGINKEFTPKLLRKTTTVTQNHNCSAFGEPTVTLFRTTKETLTKDNIYTNALSSKNTPIQREVSSSIDRIFNYWNERPDLIKHHKLMPFMAKEVKGRLNEFTEEELKNLIFLYDDVLGAKTTWFTYKWGLHEFMKRGYKTFLDKTFDSFLDNKQFPK